MAAKKITAERNPSSEPSLKQQAERLQHHLGQSAQLIWLAGVGALGRAQREGGKLFDTLVKEGRHIERRAGTHATKLRHALDSGLQGTRQRAGQALERLDQRLGGKVKDTLKSLEVPTQRELTALIDKIATVNEQLRKHNQQSTPAAPQAHKRATQKPAGTRKTTSATRAEAQKATPKKSTAAKVSKKVPAKKTARKLVRRPNPT